MDKRKEHMLGIAGSFFDGLELKELKEEHEDDNCLNKFLDQEDCLVLFLTKDGNNISFQNNVKSLSKSSNLTSLVFYKTTPVVIKTSNLYNVLRMMSMTTENPVENLHASMKQLYLPILSENESNNNNSHHNHLTSFLNKLEDMIDGKDVNDEDDADFGAGGDHNSVSKVLSTISNEVKYWDGQSRSSSHSKEAKSIKDLLSQTSTEFAALSSTQKLDEVEDVVAMLVDVLDEAWRLDESPLSEERMRNVMSGIASDLQTITSNILFRQKIWNEVGNTDGLIDSMSICKKWISQCEQLTRHFWRNLPDHPWRGSRVDFEDFEDYCEHLKKLLGIKCSVTQASILLSPSEKNELNFSKIFSNFKKYNVFRLDSKQSKQHNQLFENFDNNFQNIENVVSQKLRQRIKYLQGNQLQMIKEMSSYKELMARKNVSSEMQFEKEQMLAGLLQTVEQSINNNVESLKRDRVTIKTKNNTLLVNKMLEIQLLEGRLENTQQLNSMLLVGLPASAKLSKRIADCCEELKMLKADSFLEWTRDCQQFFNDISKNNGENLIQLNWNHGELQVTSGEKLVTMARESKTLNSLGYQLPKNVVESLKQSQKFQKYAVILKEIANFHNSIEQQILPCHKPLMLQSALVFEKLVTKYKKGPSSSSSSSIEWPHRAELESYVERLENSANKFKKEIALLRKTHLNIHKKVIDLMNTDMLRRLPVWKSQLASIRLMMNSLTNQGFQLESMKLWKHHWDIQLYKALEHQYQRGLVGFNDHVQEIRVELVFKGQKIVFRPPLEEIRAKYYKEIKKFSSIPMLFKGVGDNSTTSMFLPMIERSSEHLFMCYSRADLLFCKLVLIPDKYKSWVALGSIDTEALITSNLKEVVDWEDNLKLVKEKTKQIDKLSNEIKESCITISLIPLKLAIETQLQRLFDSLVITLKKSVTSHLIHVENFMEESKKVFDTPVSTFDDINDVNAKHIEIMTNLAKVQDTFKLINEKNTLLNSLVGEGVDGLEGVVKGWGKFEGRLNGQKEKMKDEIDVMRSNTGFKCKEFEDEVARFKNKWAHLRRGGDDDEETKKKKGGGGSFEDIKMVKEMTVEFDELQKAKESLCKECDLFQIDKPNLKSYLRLEDEMSGLSDVTNDLVLLQSELVKYEENVWLTFRTKYFAFDSFIDEWTDKLNKHTKVTFVNGIVNELRFYKQLLPLLKWVRGDAFSNENWVELFSLMDLPNPTKVSPNDLLFGHIIKHGHQISARIDPIKELNSKAQSEVVIRDALRELDGWGSSAVFTLVANSSNEYGADQSKAVMVIKEWKEVFNKIGEFQSLVQSLKNSGHYKYFQDKVTLWENRLADLDFIIHHLNEIQRRWVYLEPVFNQGTLRGEEGRFKRVDEEFRKLLSDVKRDPKIMSLLFKINLKASLGNMLDQLQRCQKTLNTYLEAKRLSFPRFYFIGDDDLLEILGQSKNPSVIQNHLKKLYSGIYSVEFDADFKRIIAIVSSEEEVVKLNKEVIIESDVEVWLISLTTEMKDTLKLMLNNCLMDKSLDSHKYPAQVLSIAGKVSFTEKCEAAISKQGLMELHAELKKQLEYYTDMNMQLKNIKTDNDSTNNKVMELKLKDLIFDTIHHVEVVEVLMKKSVKAVVDWHWQKQLRFYNNSNGSSSGSEKSCKIMMGDPEMKHQFEYTYEYQGNTPKLVHTPLTDKCYLTLTLALMNGLGGNPYGPAGTGKTESVKALGGLFGRQVLVFNCDEGIDIKSMGRIFTGLVQCGAWGCFDEFNRLEESVLSAVSTQIQLIQNASRMKASSLELLGKTVRVDENLGIFITMNPANKEYGGRQKLPDNLKQLFRPVSMSQPDNKLISEVSLYSEGFKNAKVLSTKLISLFSLCRKLLSRQQHYDWGLRALKSILKSSGSLLQHSKTKNDNTQDIKNNDEDLMTESQMLIQAVHMNTLSKLATSDRVQFLRLLKDVFKDVEFNEIRDEELQSKLIEVYEESMLQPLPEQIHKSLELHEQLKQRMGVLIVGPSRSGKSSLWQQLRLALQKLGQEVKLYAINPKAVQKSQLIGQIESESREWRDGLLTSFSRHVIKEAKEVKSWVLCDGDVDPEWVESLNSVLDDNHLLTLPSGERIQFNNNVNFIFETHDLKYASPATISRMGMIFLSEDDVTVDAVIDHWLRKRAVGGRLDGWVRDYVAKCVEWIRKEGECILPLNPIHITTTILSYLRDLDNDCDLGNFMADLITGACSNLQHDSKNRMSSEIFSMFGESPPDFENVLNFKYDRNSTKLLKYEDETTENYSASSSPSSNDKINIVMTTETQRYLDTLSKLVSMENQDAFMLIGPDGSGKRFLLEQCLETQSSSFSTQLSIIRCSAHTSPEHVIKKLEQLCSIVNTTGGRKYKPKSCEKMVLMVKDVNYPLLDKYGTSPFLAFLSQILTYGGFYDSSLEMVSLDGVQMVLTMNCHLSDISTVSSRFLSLLPTFSLCTRNVNQLENIYGQHLWSLLQEASGSGGSGFWSKRSNVDSLSKATVCLYEELKRSFNYNDHAHYIINMSHVTQWVYALKRYDMASLSSSDSPTSRQDLINVWSYEARLKFRNQLVGEKSKVSYDEIIQTVVYNVFSGKVALMDMENSLYSSCVLDGSTIKKGNLLQSISMQDFKLIMQKVIAKYAKEHGEESIVFFHEFLHLVASIDRLMGPSGGSALVAGRSGCGRKSALKLVAYMRQIDVFTPKILKSYSVKQFKADLKYVVQTCVIENQELILLLEDHHMSDDQFYELITGFVCEGDVSRLYSVDEYEAVLSTLKDQCSIDNYQGQPLQYLVMKLRRNLHTCLLLDCSNSSFVLICKNNRSLLKSLAIIWVDEWKKESYLDLVETMLLSELTIRKANDDNTSSKSNKDKHEDKDTFEDGDDDNDDDVKSKCTTKFFKMFYDIHNQLPNEHEGVLDTSPRKFTTLVKTFIRLYREKRSSIVLRKNKLQKGLEKLKDAQKHVASLKKEAGDQHKELASKQKEADDSMTEITTTLSSAGNKKVEIEDLQKEAGKESVKMDKRKKAIDEEMKEIEPIINEAKRSVGNIRNETLGEIRALRAPPDTIRDILEGVMIIMGNPDTSWLAMKSFLAKRGVKEEIQNFDARKIKPDARKRIEALLKKNGHSFDPKNAKRASEAAAPLASWVTANAKYASILERIQPLEREQHDLQSNISTVENKMKKLGHGLSKVDERVKELQKKFEKITQDNATLKLKLDRSEEIIKSAESLVEKLTEEFDRWTVQIKELLSDIDDLHFKCLYTAAVLTYLSSSPEHVRQRMKNSWAEIISLKTFDPIKFLCSENDQLQWKSEGLPSDGLSLENAVVIKTAHLTPLLIDPFSQTTEWLRNHYKDDNVEIVNMQDKNLFTQVELAVKFGKTLIIDEVDEKLDGSLVPLLRKDIVQQGSRSIIQLGDRSIDYNENFRLLLSSRFPSLSLPSSLLSLFTLVNFTTTKAGLTNQLLGITMMNVKPEIESRKTGLVEEEEEMKKQLDSLEDSLLQQLATAKGDILENKDLLESLNQTKAKSSSIVKALKESLTLQESLNTERNAYLPLASNGSKLYFAVQDLHLTSNMYHFHLDSFIRLYNKLFTNDEGLSQNAPSDERISQLVRSLTYYVYNYYSRSLFKKDCLVYATHLLYNTQVDLIKKEEWDLFIGLLTEASIGSGGGMPSWIDQKQLPAICQLKEALPDVYSKLRLEDEGLWSDFKSNKNNPQIPSKVQSKITSFQAILALKCLQPEELVGSLKEFVCSHLGFKELAAGNVNLSQLYEKDTFSTEPILFIVSPGTDPSQELEKLAKKTVGTDKLIQVALGQGQSETAIDSLKACALNGDWLFLKNLHLAVAWLPTLMKEFKSLKPHNNFRLWMTSEQHEHFPVVFLKSCLKITFEAPAGVKKNLLRSLTFWGSDLVQKTRSSSRSNTLLCLAWFHAVIQERRSYIPQGWTKFYEFNNSDLQSGVQIIDKLFNRNDSSNVPWGFIHGLFESAVYGGRVDSRHDNRVLVSYLTQIFNSNSSKSLGPLHLPSTYNYKDYIDSIETLEDTDQPDWFGLPENIDHVVKKLATDEVVAKLKRLKVATTKRLGFDREVWSNELSPVMKSWKKMYSDKKLAKNKSIPPSSDNPIQQFIHFEYDIALAIVDHVNKSMCAIEKVLSGKQMLTEDVVGVVNDIISVQTPSSWSSKWDGPDHPSTYMQSLVRKATSVGALVDGGWERWIESPIRLSELFNPESFLSAHRQLSARNLNCSIDGVRMNCEWLEGRGSKGKDLKISGLKVAGCNFDGRKLTEKSKDDPVLMDIPLCRITWYEKKSFNINNSNNIDNAGAEEDDEDVGDDDDDDRNIKVPLYYEERREKVATILKMPIEGNKNKWVQLMPALFIE